MLTPDVLAHFLALRVEVSLIATALAELVRTQRLNAHDAGRYVGTSSMPVVARYMGWWEYPCEKLGC